MTTAVQTVADALLQARRQNETVDAAPLEALLQSPEDAYAVQDRVAQASGWATQPVARCWKSGGPARGAALTHAPLPEAGVRASPADLRDLPFHLRLIEAEIALRLARDVTADQAAQLTHEAAPALVDAMTVSIEVVDTRWRQGRQTGALLKLADLQAHGALALGEWVPFAPHDWARQTCSVQIGDAAPQVFQGTHSLQDPAWLLPIWLRHVTRHGDNVPRGTVVTTGTWCGLLEAKAGDRVRVVFDSIGQAQLQL